MKLARIVSLSWILLVAGCGDDGQIERKFAAPQSLSLNEQTEEIVTLEVAANTYLKRERTALSAQTAADKCPLDRLSKYTANVYETDGYQTHVKFLDKVPCSFKEGWVRWDDFTVIDVKQPENNLPFPTFEPGARIHVCHINAGLNFYKTAASDGAKWGVLDVGNVAQFVEANGEMYQIKMKDKVGFVKGKYLCDAKPWQVSRDDVINYSKEFVGYSYWWGGAKLKVGPHATRKCFDPAIDTFGADCSGFVGKVWQLPEAMPFTEGKHPYSTRNFYFDSELWYPVPRQETRRGDAMVYRNATNTGGHIIIYESKTDWEHVKPYEARGCDWGIVDDVRPFGSEYRSLRLRSIIEK